MFPLGSVLFPTMVLPLHVFEPRYRALVGYCLEHDGEFGVVLIERGREVGGGDVRTSLGTVARIVEAGRFDDGRWALTTVGVRRIIVRSWLPDDPYPRADVEDWDDPPAPDDMAERVAPVVARLRRVLSLAAELGDRVPPATLELADDPVVAAYQACALAPIGPVDRHELLGAPDPATRLARLDELLATQEDLLRFRMSEG